MTPYSEWPALRLDRQSKPGPIEYERGVFGKVHGARTDYRWIARSEAFARNQPDLHLQLNLGTEDVPARFQAWRNLGDHCFAVSAYPSRAIDDSGRSNFLEKQIVEWRRPPDVPAALGALFLLSHAAAMTDAVWWTRAAGETLARTDACLPIGKEDHLPLEIEDNRVAELIEHGRRELRETVNSNQLEQLYDQILSRQRPAFFLGLSSPLSPEALACLLLPLPRDIADRISIAGWVPSSRPSFSDLGSRWDILLTPPNQAVSVAVPAESQIAAWTLAENLIADTGGFLLDNPFALDEPQQPEPRAPDSTPFTLTPVDTPAPTRWLRPGRLLDLTPPESPAPQIVVELYDFARSPDRRWLSPGALRQAGSAPLSPSGSVGRLLSDWVQQVRDGQPPYAHDEQWEVKVDLLRSAALVMAPSLSTLQAVGIPGPGSRVPALFFGSLLERSRLDNLADFGERDLRQLLSQSLACRAPKALVRKLRDWLVTWQGASRRRNIDVPAILRDALKSSPA